MLWRRVPTHLKIQIVCELWFSIKGSSKDASCQIQHILETILTSSIQETMLSANYFSSVILLKKENPETQRLIGLINA